MDLQTKKERISLVKTALNKVFRKVDNVGAVFFVSEGTGCVLRDVVFRHSKSIGLEFEVLTVDKNPYFVGTKEHAVALFSAFGGSYSPSEYCHSMTHHMNLWIWSAPLDKDGLSLEEDEMALF